MPILNYAGNVVLYFQSIHLVCSHACSSILVPFVFVCVSVCKKIVIKKNKDLIYLKLSDGLYSKIR